jgi:magnesium-transporting ATPase (P-type)
LVQYLDQAIAQCHDYCKIFHPTRAIGHTNSQQVLAFAMALSFGIKDYIEGGVLVFVIVLNVTIGFWQEYRAEKRMDALRALSSPSAMVLRDGKTQVISK